MRSFSTQNDSVLRRASLPALPPQPLPEEGSGRGPQEEGAGLAVSVSEGAGQAQRGVGQVGAAQGAAAVRTALRDPPAEDGGAAVPDTHDAGLRHSGAPPRRPALYGHTERRSSPAPRGSVNGVTAGAALGPALGGRMSTRQVTCRWVPGMSPHGPGATRGPLGTRSRRGGLPRAGPGAAGPGRACGA